MKKRIRKIKIKTQDGDVHLVAKVKFDGKTYELARGKVARLYLSNSPPDPLRPVRFWRIVKGKARSTWRSLEDIDSLNATAHQMNKSFSELHGSYEFAVPTFEEISVINLLREFADKRKEAGKPVKLYDMVSKAIAREETQEETPLFSEVVKLFLKDRQTLNPVSTQRYQQCVSALKYFGKRFDNRHLSAIRAADVQKSLSTENFAPDTIASYSGVIRVLFNWWYRQANEGRRIVDKIPNPLESMPIPRVAKTKEVEIISPETLRLYLAEVRRKAFGLLPLVVLQSFCALRRSEALRLRHGDIKEDSIFLSCSITKTQLSRTVPLCEAAKKWLALIKSQTGSHAPNDFVVHPEITSDREKRLNSERLKFAYASDIKLHKNVCRHSAITFWSQLHDYARVADWAGNSVRVSGVHYRALSNRAEAEKWFSVFPDPEEKTQ